MSGIQKFSTLRTENQQLLESIKSRGNIANDLIKKMGYSSIEEISKERKILAKLESLLREIPAGKEINEDEVEEIENKLKRKAEPKSLASKMGDKEEDGKAGGSNEVSEDSAEEIKDEINDIGKPKSLEDKEGELEEEPIGEDSVEEIEDEINDIGKPRAARKIMTFEEFVANESKTINKNVSYRDDDDEKEDYAEPVPEKKSFESVNEANAKVKSDEDFKEYAFSVLQKAFGDEFDEGKAQEVVDGLISKYSGDYGAMIGALQSSLG